MSGIAAERELLEAIVLPKSDELVRQALMWNYGEVHTHTEIAKIMNILPKNPKYGYLISAAQKKLLIAGKVLESVHGQGYRVIYPDEYKKVAAKNIQRGHNCVVKAKKIVTHAPVNHMTTFELQEFNATKDAIYRYQTKAEPEVENILQLAVRPMAIVCNSD